MSLIKYTRRLSRGKNGMIFIYSFGGVGTTMFYDFIRRYRPVNTQSNVHHGLETLLFKNERAVYLFGNPIEAILSFYRRQATHDHFIDQHALHLRVRSPISKSLDEYIIKGEDQFELERHFDQYINAKKYYPILFVKYPDLWENLSPVMQFLNLKEHQNSFPARRNRESKISHLSKDNLEKLLTIHQPLIDKIEKLSPVFVLENTQIKNV